MDIEEVLSTRRSVREFQATPVPREHLEQIVRAGLFAPTASNRQHWRIVAVTNPDVIKELHNRVGAQDIVYNPPVVLTVVYNPLFNSRRSAHVQSSAAAVENMILKANSMGYGTTWVAGMGDDKELRDLLKIPDHWEPMCYVLLGKIARTFPPPPPKYALDEVLFFDQFFEEEVDLPDSIKPRNCTLEQVKNHQNYLSRSSYLGKDYDYQHSFETSEIVSRVSDLAGNQRKTIVSFFSYDGTVYRHFNSLMSVHKFIDVELSVGAKDFVQFKSPDSDYLISNGRTDLDDASADLCMCLFSLEKIPDYQMILDEANRILKDNGKLLVFFKNKRSFYGAIYFLVEKILGVRSISAVFPLSPGPYEPISSTQLIRVIERNNFFVERKEGMFFMPAEVMTFSEKVDGYLKRHGKYLNVFQYLIKPTLRAAVASFYVTKKFRPFSLSSSCYVIAGRRSKG